ncbi:post-GPI attachment to proteins factor 2-like isoform X3 [Homarus americanus]|uniref:post-GPI attachment to proteins factor 2-like isoform X3 n=1 Tax=Homarus americanus TaxID=6706 RepID=UPI001C486537|nr:post-GPI attachment to proteins factor 2-like isoform X3 [Homarus americanus]
MLTPSIDKKCLVMEPLMMEFSAAGPVSEIALGCTMTESDAVVRVSVARLAVVTVSLPLGAFFLCIYLSLRFNFDLSTATHCGNAVKVTTLLNVVENVALLSLSFVSSKENYDVHKVSFILFMVCSELYMVLTCLLLKDNARRFTTPLERLAFVKKKQLMTANLASFVIALYFFYRHNKYCEPGMYSVFAFMEYIVVLTNMAFHMTAYYDFHNHDLVVCEWKTASS